MKIRYHKLPDLVNPDGHSWYPFLQVCLRQTNRGRIFLALVDSGAADCIFPASIGTLLGIDVPSGRPQTYYGLAGQASPAFVHEVNLQVTGFNSWITIEAGFVIADVVPLLGQRGFFENYRVVFERFRLQFEVYTKMDALRPGSDRGY